jgi:hypothetical protein
MVKLIIPGGTKKETIKNTMFRNHKKFCLLIKVLELFLRCPILIFVYKSSDVVSSADWLVSSIWSLCPQGIVK